MRWRLTPKSLRPTREAERTWTTVSYTHLDVYKRQDRDANFIKTNDAGVTVNRWNTTGFLASSAASNEAGYLSHKVLRGLGNIALDTQARI